MWQYLALRKLGAFFAETILIAASVLLGYFVQMKLFPAASAERYHILSQAFLIAILFQITLHLCDIYRARGSRVSGKFVLRLLLALVLACCVMTLLFFMFPKAAMNGSSLASGLVFGSAFIMLWHAMLRLYLGVRHPHTNLLVLGTSPLAKEAVREILRHPEFGIKVMGFVGDDPKLVGVSIVNPKVIGLYQDLPQLVEKHKIDRIVVGLADRRGKLPIKELLGFKTRGIAIEDATTFYERVAGKIPIENLKPSWLVFNSGFSVSKRLIQKRLFSLLVSSVLLLLLSPIFLLAMILIKLDSKGPVFYKQARVGQNGRNFMLVKFRSMRQDAEKSTGPVWSKGADDDRVTRVGRILRRTRIDELPQFFNVFRGDMSLVGPRPERPHFVQQLSEEIPYYPVRHVIKPGITGWAQIKYGYASTLEHTIEKLQYDLFYIKNMSWILDIFIVFETVKTVLVKRGS